MVCGGGANMRGLAEELTAGVRAAMNEEDKLTMDAAVESLPFDTALRTSVGPARASCGTSAWFGGAIVGLVDTSREGWVSASTVAHGRLAMPDVPLRDGSDEFRASLGELTNDRSKFKGSEPMQVFTYGTPSV